MIGKAVHGIWVGIFLVPTTFITVAVCFFTLLFLPSHEDEIRKGYFNLTGRCFSVWKTIGNLPLQGFDFLKRQIKPIFLGA
jgi:hypothetical protein